MALSKEELGFVAPEVYTILRGSSSLRAQKYLFQILKSMWPYEHIAKTPPKALEEACSSEIPGNLRISSFSYALLLQTYRMPELRMATPVI